MSNDLERIRSLMALATGDEKHDPSAHSTLDVLSVLRFAPLAVSRPRLLREELSYGS